MHKFQGQEKENIIISTVDDYITEFADNPYLINVAVSRAKSKLIVVVSGNEQIKDSNIMDLVGYVKYNNFEIVQSKVNSIFDYLYKQYDNVRYKDLQTNNLISKYPSENIAYSLINEILNEDYRNLDVKFAYPLRSIVRNINILDEKEQIYVKNNQTHVDFLIFRKIDKSPVLVIEVDGYDVHKKGTKQAARDDIKNSILNKCDISFVRLSTNGSNEKQKIIDALEDDIKKRNNKDILNGYDIINN